ncbi:MAG: hypothetical protein JO051_07800 [Acidobacteriaceae bacterium]|nr:hypothetical protein [Acidobacteriaceae bacterium]
MLDQVILWVDIAGVATEVLLLLRVLQLRLQRVYLFLALACGLTVFLDLAQLWWGLNSSESQRIFVYSRFLYAAVYPLVAWDVFEEMKPQVTQMRRMAAVRMISALCVAAVFGFVLTLFMTAEDQPGGMGAAMAIILWAGSSAASLTFLFTLQRALKAQQIERPHNTFVWMTFYQLTLICELVACFTATVAPLLHATPLATSVLEICLILYSLSITLWCAARLKRIPADVSTVAKADA